MYLISFTSEVKLFIYFCIDYYDMPSGKNFLPLSACGILENDFVISISFSTFFFFQMHFFSGGATQSFLSCSLLEIFDCYINVLI